MKLSIIVKTQTFISSYNTTYTRHLVSSCIYKKPPAKGLVKNNTTKMIQ